MSTSDWNTVASDLQRAVNNLAWFVLESMAVPEQPPYITPLQHLPSMLPPSSTSSSNNVLPPKKRAKKERLSHDKESNKMCVGAEVDKLVAETLL
jgi:hypothetical protein